MQKQDDAPATNPSINIRAKTEFCPGATCKADTLARLASEPA